MAVVGVGEVLVRPSMAGFQREVGKEIAGAGDSAPVQRAGGKLGGFIKAGLKVGATAGVAAIGVAITKGFSRLTAIEAARAKLSGLGHDAKSVESIMKNATAAVKGTAFGLDDAATVAASAVAAGVKPGKDLERTLKLVGDAATIAGTDMGSMGAIFNKVKSSNKLQMDSINQLHDAGIPALQLVAEELGVSAEEASKMASDGKISFDVFQKAMAEGMGGAALKSGETLQGAFANSMAAIGRFGANLISGVYPQIRDFFTKFIGFMGPVEEMGKVIGQVLGDALKNFIGWLQQAGTWIQNNRAWIEPLVVAIGAMATAWALWTGAIKAWQMVTKIAMGVQAAFNAVMAANPIGIVILAITGLVAAIVYLYKNNETARRIIDAVWKAIKGAILGAWNGIKTAFEAVKTWFTKTLPDAWNKLKATNQAVWDGVKKKITDIWTGVKIIFETIKTWFTTTLTNAWNGFRDTNKRVWDGIKSKISGIWNDGIKPVFNAVKNFLKDTLGPTFTWLKDKVISPVWNGIKTIIDGVWKNGIKPVFTAIQQLLKGDFKGAFQTAKDAIDRIWKGVANVVRKPINFVIGTVYNDGIRAVFNKIAGLVGIGELKPADTIKAYAKGGLAKKGWALVGEEGPELVNFSNPGRVYTAAETRAMLAGQAQAPEGAFDGLNVAGLLGPAHAGIGGWLDGPFNAIKGVVNSVGSAVKKGFDWVRGGLAKAAEWVLKPILDGLTSNLGDTWFGKVTGGLAKKALDGAISWLRGKDAEAVDDGGAMFYDGALGKFAKPANGPITSGFGTSRGRYPHAGIDFAVSIGSAVRSMLNGIVRKIGWNAVTGRTGKGMVVDHAQGYSSYYGHLSGWGKKPGDQVKAGERIASSGNTGRSTGPHLHAELWKNGKPFNYRNYLYDNGGVVPTGLRTILNASRKPEALLSNSQWRNISTLAAQGARSFPESMTLVLEDGSSFRAYVKDAAGERVVEMKRQARQGNRQMNGAR